MGPIFPLHEDHINKYCGIPVCIITHEGNRHVGILSSCSDGRVYLNGNPEEAHATSIGNQGTVNRVKAKNTHKKVKNAKPKQPVSIDKVQTQAWYPNDYYGYSPYNRFGEAFGIDLATIAFLFLLL